MSIISTDSFNNIVSKFPKVDPILVIGDLGIDKYTHGDVKRISPEAPVPVLEVTKEWLKLGLAANVSHNLNTLGVKSTLCGVIGEDLNGKIFDNLMNECSLGPEGLIRIAGRPTTFKERVVTNTQQICRVDYESKDMIKSNVVEQVIGRVDQLKSGHGAVIIEDYAKGLFSESLISGIVDLFKGTDKIVAVDPSRTTPPMFYKGVTLLKPNQVESELMVQNLGYRETNIDKIAEILIDKLDLTMLIITMGGDGMALVDTRISDKLTVIPTVATEVFDVSGAGDTAISAITSSLLAGASLEEAAWIGNCASGVVVGKSGTATLSIAELTEFHAHLQQTL